jgi:hypothetical protein
MYENIEDLYQAKALAEENLLKAKELVRPVSKAYNEWSSVKAKAASSAKIKFVIREKELSAAFELLLREGYSAYKRYREIVEDINESYLAIIFSEESRQARRKLENEAEKFRKTEERNEERLDRQYAPFASYYVEQESAEEQIGEIEDPFDENDTASQQYYQEPYTVPQYQYNPYQQQNVNIAPVNLDISAIVENAVRSAMGKFQSALDARMNSYIGSMPKTVNPNSNGAASDVIIEMATKVCDDEKFVLDRLIELLNNLKDVGERLASLSLLCNEILEKERIAGESARRVNDMQRQLSRELQAAIANQKIIASDQMAVADELHAVFERQKTVLDKQNVISDTQKVISENQATVLEKQKRIEKAMRPLVISEKEQSNEKEAPAEEPAVLSTEETAEEPAVLSTEETAEEPAVLSTEETAEEPAVLSTEETAEEPAVLSTEETAEEPAVLSTEETAEEPAVLSTEETAEEPAVLSNEETAEEPAVLSTEETAEEPAVLSTEETAEAPTA